MRLCAPRLACLLSSAAWLGACAVDGGVGRAVVPAEHAILDAPTSALVALPDGRLLLEQAGAMAVLNPRSPTPTPVVVGLASEIGRVHAVTREGDAWLVFAEGGTFVLRGASFIPSPLAESLDGPIRGAAQLPTATGRGVGERWVLTDASIYRIAETTAERFLIEGDLAGAQLAVVARPEGPALWLLLSDRLLEVWRDRTGVLRSARVVLSVLPTAIAGDADGRAFLVIGGRLHTLGADRVLSDRGVAAEALIGSPDASDVWVLGEQLFVHSSDTVHPIDDQAVSLDDRLSLGPDGSLFVGDASSVRRLRARQDVELMGPEDGALLGGATRVIVTVSGEPTVEATLDGDAIDVSGGVFMLDPTSLADGTHALEVRVIYEDGTLPTEVRRSFEVVANATWGEHVQPIYDANCAACHGEAGPANTRLDTPERWTPPELAAQILENVREGRMPLGRAPLGQRDVALIEAWMGNGFAP